MNTTTAQLLDYYKEHVSELLSEGRITATEAASAEHHAECIAAGTNPFESAVAEAEDITRDA